MDSIKVRSSIDGSVEENLFYIPESGGNVPLLVGLHTWSENRFTEIPAVLERCQKRGWACLLPEFRGPNLATNPRAQEACGSVLAKQDIIDALEYVLAEYPIDKGNVFLLGGSGGGHMALMMAAYAPKVWKAVSAWCPITDLAAWHEQNANYAPNIAACCGGKPGTSEEVDRQYRERSPLSYAEQIAKANVFVHHGRFDHGVPYSHTCELIERVEELQPENFFYEIFRGGHELYSDAAFDWLAEHIEVDVRQSLSG